MIDINIIRNNPDFVKRGLLKRGKDYSAYIDNIILLDNDIRMLKAKIDTCKSKLKNTSSNISLHIRNGETDKVDELKKYVQSLKNETKAYEADLESLEYKLSEIMVIIPNIPHDMVSFGTSPDDNTIVYRSCNDIDLPSNDKPHWDLIDEYNLIDFNLGIKITGAGFPVYRGVAAKLQRGLINFFIDEASKAGYEEIIPPFLVNYNSAFSTGQLPDKDGQMYYVNKDELYLIPTAEVPITNIYRDVVLDEKQLPIKNVAYSPCFRREAGSWGSHVRGLNRLHQFEKVEIVQIVSPDKSYDILNEMVDHVKGILNKLELPYRILKLCGGDMGFTSALTYDFETYSSAQKRWLEVSSVSNFESFQSNRLKCRYKTNDGRNKLVHTLNGSALALPRILATILENNQTSDGILIPKVLIPYVGFDKIKKPLN